MLLYQNLVPDVSLNLLLSYYNYFKIKIIYQTTSCIIIFLASCNLFNVFECLHIIFYCQIKKVSSISKKITVFLLNSWNKIFFCDLLGVHYFQMITQNVSLPLKTLDLLNNLNIGFKTAFIMLIDICSK